MVDNPRRENDPNASEDGTIDDETVYSRVRDSPLYVCVPYDAFVITAQIMSIVTVFLSCLTWISFIINLVGMMPFQMLWCRRQQKSTLILLVLVAGVCSLSFISFGVYYLYDDTILCKSNNLYSYVLETYGFRDRLTDRCPTHLWAGLSVSCGILWAIATICIAYFIKSGRYDMFEQYHNTNTDDNTDENINRDATRINNKKSNPVVELGTIHEVQELSNEFSDSLSELSFACCSDV